MNYITRRKKFCLEFNMGDFVNARKQLDKMRAEHSEHMKYDKSIISFIALFEKQEKEPNY